MGLMNGPYREDVPEEVEDHLTGIEERAYGLRKLLEEYGITVNEDPIYNALEEIRGAIRLGGTTDPLDTPEAGALANH